MIAPVEIALAFLLDLAIGDPRWLPHPVRLIGRAIAVAERALRAAVPPRAGGVVLALAVPSLSALVAYMASAALKSLPAGAASFAGAAIYIYLLSTTLALRGLVSSALDIAKAGGLDERREKLAMIVGRDTGVLGEQGVRRAAVESLSENASDGFVAPLFYMAIGGLPLAVFYKAVNTLDSMVGYKDERYREFGRASARLDDLLNYIPARLTGLLIVGATYIVTGFDAARARRAFNVMRRDGRRHASPNSGVPEAAMAGALGVRLGGPSAYQGVLVHKPYINEGGGEIEMDAFKTAVSLTAASCTLCAALAVLLRGLL